MQLGTILLKRGWLSMTQLDRLLEEQSKENRRLGELCLNHQLISGEQLEQALQEQFWRKNGFWIIDY